MPRRPQQHHVVVQCQQYDSLALWYCWLSRKCRWLAAVAASLTTCREGRRARVRVRLEGGVGALEGGGGSAA
jgi:hypothetical protein